METTQANPSSGKRRTVNKDYDEDDDDDDEDDDHYPKIKLTNKIT